MKESKVDVLVIGAGPAGLFCANGLAKAGVNVRIVDNRPEKVIAGQADGIQPRTLEILQSYGLAERLIQEGTQLHIVAIWGVGPEGGIARKERAVNITTASTRTLYPFETTMHQGHIESIFIDSMASMGLKVDRPVAPSSMEVSTDEVDLADPTSHPVKVVLQHLTGENRREVVHAKFVVGTDGAHSWVRKASGIAMEGEHTDSLWGVLDIRPETDWPDIRNKGIINSAAGTCGVIPREHDMVRLYIQLTEEHVSLDAQGKLLKTETTPKRLLEVAQDIFKPYKLNAAETFWWTIYKIGQRVSTRYSVHERVFIAGDACHTHSPKAGQGMNASMCDSHNLAWKLTQVLRGWADMSLLRTYEAERRTYAEDLISFDKTWSKLLSSRSANDKAEETVQDGLLSYYQSQSEFTSGLSVHYAPSTIVDASNQSFASRLTIGKRMPPQRFVRAADGQPCELQDLLPADTRFKVLVFVGDTNNKDQMKRVNACAHHLERTDAFFKHYGGNDPTQRFNLLILSAVSAFDTNSTELIRIFRIHWSQVFADDAPMYEHRSSVGQGYDEYGISRTEGAIIVVRPDGYVAKVASVDQMSQLDAYFSGFLKTR